MMNPIIQTLTAIFLILFYWIKGIVLFFVPRRLRFKDINGEIVLITGGGGGLGRALAVRFAKLGAHVIIVDINKTFINETVEMVKKEGGKANGYELDITNRRDVYDTAEKIRKEIGNVTILVNNAGVVNGKKLLDIPDEKIIQTFNVNVLSHFWTIKAFLPDMIKKNHGHIVSISSVAGSQGSVKLSDYCASKHAVNGLEESLRLELIADGINGVHSTVICPYFMKTPLFAGFKSSPLLQPLDPEDMADQIMIGVLTNQPMVAQPKTFYTLNAIKTMIPTNSFYVLYSSLGGYDCMNDFVGRNDDNRNNNEKKEKIK